jgi:hypothetical protein
MGNKYRLRRLRKLEARRRTAKQTAAQIIIHPPGIEPPPPPPGTSVVVYLPDNGRGMPDNERVNP